MVSTRINWVIIPVICLLVLAASDARAKEDDLLFLKNDATGISLRYKVVEFRWEDFEYEGEVYRTPYVKGCGMFSPEGAPQLPVRIIWLVIPPGATPVLNGFIPYGMSDFSGIPAPVETIQPNSDGSVRYEYIEAPEYYSAVNPYPNNWVEIQGPETYRDLQVIRLLIFPYRYPSSSGGIMGLDSIEVHITLAGGSGFRSGYSRSIEDEFYQGIIANWQDNSKGWKMPALPRTDIEDLWPSGDFYKIKINESGIYKLTYDYLTNAGIDLTDLDPRTIRIFNNGGEILPQNLITPRPQGPIENAIMVTGEEDGSFDPGDEVWFYGKSVHDWEKAWVSDLQRYCFRHYQNPYTEENVYWLNINPTGPVGERMQPLGTEGTFTINPTSTLAYYFQEEELYAIYDGFNLPTKMPELYGALFSGTLASRTFNFNLEDVVDYDEARLLLNLLAGDMSYHQFAIYVNSTFIGNTPNKKYTILDTLEIPEGILQNGNNTLRLEHMSDGTEYLDYFELEYTKSLSTTSDELPFFSPSSQGLCKYEIGGLESPWIFDITEFDQVKAIHSASFKDSCSILAPRRYIAVEASALRTPLSITEDQRNGDEYANLRSTLGADVLVIAPDQFYDAMAEYESYRENMSPTPMEVLRVKVSDIYDEYGWGLPDPVAIRDFLKGTLPIYNWAVSPLYVLFAGDGDWDYKNKLSSGDANWVIPFVDNSRCTDDWYAYFTPSDDFYSYPQLAMGRWPVQSVEEVEYMIQRVIEYESSSNYGPWRNRLVFVADDEYGEGGNTSSFETRHQIDTENIAENLIPDFFNVQKIYMSAYPVSYDPAGAGRRKPEANADLMAAINDGCLVVNYMGHGNPTVWAHEHVFLQSRDLPLLNNGYELPLFIAATCDWAYWDNPYSKSMPEIMVSMEYDGAIGTLAATRVTGATANKNFLENFFPELFAVPESRRLGEALMRAKISSFVHVTGGASNNANAEKYHLLGDPVLRLGVPQLQVVFNSSSGDTLRALDNVTVAGNIVDNNGNTVPSFEGVANLQVFDTKIPIEYVFANGSLFQYQQPGNLIFRGDASVEAGEFEAQFVVPVDISYAGEQSGRFSVYAFSDDIDGTGAYDSVFISESAVSLQDSVPPELRVYFDSPGFRSGDAVGSGATLYVEVSDSNGVNLTGSVGHGIIVTIDGKNPIELTDSFSYYLNSYTSGIAEHKLIPGEISPGVHTAEAIAWDAANNPNTSEVTFTLMSTGSGIVVSDVLNYPNPMKNSTTFTFTLAVPGSGQAFVTIKIYTVAGRLIKVIPRFLAESTFNYDSPNLVWNGWDESGDPLSNGTYIYKVIADNGFGSRGEATGKLIVMRGN